MVENPLYGHKLVKLTSTSSNTVILRIKHAAYMEFLHPDKVDLWHEKEQALKFPEQIRLQSSTKRVREKFFSNFSLKKYQPGEIILKAGTMPPSIILVAKGNVEVRS